MNEIDIIRILPALYNLINKPMTRYDILKKLGLQPNTARNYKKIDECIDMGFLKKEDPSKQFFVADKERIWDFWKKTPSGKVIYDMFNERTVGPIE